jgi:hypothetical protein
LLSDDNLGELMLQHDPRSASVSAQAAAEDSKLTQLLNHELQIAQRHQNGACGLIPFAGPAQTVHTTGFKWNLGMS